MPAIQPIHGEGDYVVDVKLTSAELVYGLINHDNETDYTSLTLRLGTPTVNNNAQHDRNTKIFAQTRPGAPKQGSTYFYYDRISLAYYLQNYPDLEVDITDEMITMRDLIPWMNETFGLGLVAEDVRADLIDRSPNAENRFAMSAASLAWQDSVLLQITVPPVDIATLEGNPALDAIEVVSEHPRTYGQLYGYQVDTTAMTALLTGLPIGALSNLNGQNLSQALSTATTDYWAFDATPVVRNLYGASVRFNGRSSDQALYPTKPDNAYMVIVDIVESECLEFEGPLVLYYTR